jgi:hypothetical protein
MISISRLILLLLLLLLPLFSSHPLDDPCPDIEQDGNEKT